MRMRFKNHADETRWGNSSWKMNGHGFDMSIEDFLDHHIGSYILEAMHTAYQEYEQLLSTRRRGMRTRAHFQFNDVRDEKWYLAREHTVNRMETIKDLLLTTDPVGEANEPVITVIVLIDDVPIGGPVKSPRVPTNYHRYGMGRVKAFDTGDDRQQHDPMSFAVLLPYFEDMDEDSQPASVVVPQRKVNNAVIGCVGDGVTVSTKKTRLVRLHGDGLILTKISATTKPGKKRCWKLLRPKLHQGWPTSLEYLALPPITFLRYKPKDGVDNIEKGVVSLAIRIKTWLNAIQAGNITLPLDWTEVVESHITATELCVDLVERMQDSFPSSGMKMLERTSGRWRIDVWLMPQDGQMEKLHFLRKDEQLYQFGPCDGQRR